MSNSTTLTPILVIKIDYSLFFLIFWREHFPSQMTIISCTIHCCLSTCDLQRLYMNVRRFNMHISLSMCMLYPYCHLHCMHIDLSSRLTRNLLCLLPHGIPLCISHVHVDQHELPTITCIIWCALHEFSSSCDFVTSTLYCHVLSFLMICVHIILLSYML